MLKFIKAHTDKYKIAEEEYRVLPILEEMGREFSEEIGDRKIELIFDIDKNLPAVLYGDSFRIRQIVTSLMKNAIAYTQEGYIRLLVKVYPLSEDGATEVYVSVRDTGSGINEREIHTLFRQNIFKKYNSVNKDQGLYGAQRLAQKMGGEIHVKSEAGKGSEFWFSIRQGVADPAMAASVRLSDENRIPRVSSKFANSYREEALMLLINAYRLSYIPYDILQDVGMTVDYIFTDPESYQEAGQEMTKLVRKRKDICILQNPFSEYEKPEGVTIEDRPFFSLNFCRFLNHEEEIAPDVEMMRAAAKA